MSKTIGDQAEEAVCAYIEKAGMTILARNWTNRKAEIDIIAKDKSRRLHFIEVKYRKNSFYGGGYGAINKAKQKQLINGALWWLQEQGNTQSYWQIDVANVSGASQELEITILDNAVTAY